MLRSAEAHARMVMAICTIAAALCVLALAWPLPPEGFVSGDQGVKLVAALNALAHPASPTQITPPRVGGHPVPFMDPFYVQHGAHAHALQAPLFPVLSAPFIAVLGLRGAYVLPALAFVVMLPLLGTLIRAAVPGVTMAAVACCTTLVSPVWFYAFEFWEHGPAVAVLAGASALMWRATSQAWARPAAAGMLAGVAVLLRPEAVWYAAALGLVWGVSRRAVAYAAGTALVLAVFAAFNVWEGGSSLGYHASANLAALSDHWTVSRVDRLTTWMIPTHPLFLAAIGGIGAAWVLRHRQQGERALLVALAAAGLSEAVREGASRRLRVGLVCVIVGCGVWTSRAAYRDLRGAKQMYAQLVHGLDQATSPGGYVVTSVWWLDQVAAALSGSRTFLEVPAGEEPRAALASLERAGVPIVEQAWSTESGERGPLSTAGTCYVAGPVVSLPQRGVQVTRAICRRPDSR